MVRNILLSGVSVLIFDFHLVIEDFFRFLADGIMFHPAKIIMSDLLQPIIEASLAALDLQQTEPLLSVLQFLRDLLAYGREAPPNSSYQDYRKTPIEVRNAVQAAAASMGLRITQRILSGLMYSFPSDCVTDSSGVLLELVELCPLQMIQWIKSTLELLPPGSVSPAEAQKFLKGIETAAINKDWNKIRYTLRDFTSWYRRKNVRSVHCCSTYCYFRYLLVYTGYAQITTHRYRWD